MWNYFKNSLGEALIRTPDGVSASNGGVRIGLQGTSSLSYNAKNFELYMGNMDAEVKGLLSTYLILDNQKTKVL